MHFGPKCITIITTKPPNVKEYTRRRRQIPHDQDLRLLRRAIIHAALDHYEEVREAYETIEQTDRLCGRSFDYWSPLLAICKVFMPERYDELLSLAEEYSEYHKPSDTMVEIENEALRYVAQIVREGETGAYLKKITAFVKEALAPTSVSWQKVKSALSNLGVVKSYRHKPDGLFVYFRADVVHRKVVERFGEEFEKQQEEQAAEQGEKERGIAAAIMNIVHEYKAVTIDFLIDMLVRLGYGRLQAHDAIERLLESGELVKTPEGYIAAGR